MCGVKDAGPSGARAATGILFFKKALSVTDGPVLMDTRGVIYQYTGPPKVPPCGTYAMRRRGPKCRGFPGAGNGIGEVLNITAPCVWESEACFMITHERSEAKTVRGSRSDGLEFFHSKRYCAGPSIRAGPLTPVRWTGALI